MISSRREPRRTRQMRAQKFDFEGGCHSTRTPIHLFRDEFGQTIVTTERPPRALLLLYANLIPICPHHDQTS